MWRQVSVATEESLAESLSDFFSELGAISVSLQDEGDQPLFEPKPGEIPLWKATRVIALFEPDVDTDLIRAGAAGRYGARDLQDWRVETIEDQAWERAWLEHFKPMRFGRRLWIVPSGFPEPEEPGAIAVSLDPGLAFGTGTHPTTALCLEWLDGLGPELKDKTLIDYGCGSGILAVAALKLGAGLVYGVDLDPQALTATAENARKNAVESRVRCSLPAGFAPGPADLLVANILANPLVELASRLASLVKPGGGLALSGILRDQVDVVAAAYAPYFALDIPRFREDWSCLAGVRREV